MFTSERRLHKRFIIPGSAHVRWPDGSTALLEVLNVSRGGLLLLTSDPPPLGTPVKLRFTISKYNPEIEAEAHVVRQDKGAMGISFRGVPEGIDELVNWLETDWMLDIFK